MKNVICALILSSVSALAMAQQTTVLPKVTLNNQTVLDTSKCSLPQYNQDELDSNKTGSVQLKFLVTGLGEVLDQKIVTSSGHPSLDQKSLRAISRCEFIPAQRTQVSEFLIGRWIPVTVDWKIDNSK